MICAVEPRTDSERTFSARLENWNRHPEVSPLATFCVRLPTRKDSSGVGRADTICAFGSDLLHFEIEFANDIWKIPLVTVVFSYASLSALIIH